MESVQEAIRAMHRAGISQSQIEHNESAADFVVSSVTVQAARAGLRKMAAAVGGARAAVGQAAANAFMAAFLDTKHRLAHSIVRSFSNEIRNEQQTRRFLYTVRRYMRVYMAQKNFHQKK
jgi:hypothetical protein